LEWRFRYCWKHREPALNKGRGIEIATKVTQSGAGMHADRVWVAGTEQSEQEEEK